MAARALRRAAPVALLATLLFALGAAVAYAVLLPTGPAIVVGAADYTAGTVHVSVDASTGLSAVRFEDSDGTTLSPATGRWPAHRFYFLRSNSQDEKLCPIHRGPIAMSGPRSLAVHSEWLHHRPVTI